MKVKYFKNSPHHEDLYMKGNDEMKLVMMSEKHFTLFANDEGGPIFGHYQEMNLTKKEYNELLNLAIDQDRKKGISLLNIIHLKNPDLDKSSVNFHGEIPFYLKASPYDLFQKFQKSNPILK